MFVQAAGGNFGGKLGFLVLPKEKHWFGQGGSERQGEGLKV